jgi:hypothetical protein
MTELFVLLVVVIVGFVGVLYYLHVKMNVSKADMKAVANDIKDHINAVTKK